MRKHFITLRQLLGRLATLPTLAAVATLGLAAPGAVQAADVGVSVSISQPGVYGRIDIGRFPQPQLVVQQPVLLSPAARGYAPVYVYAPPGHRKNWKQHCRSYGACGVPVYFVTERWYQQRVQPYLVAYPGPARVDPRYGYWHSPRHAQYAPHWRDDRRADWRDDRRDDWRDDRRDSRQDERRKDWRDDRRGPGDDGHRGGRGRD